MPVLSRPILLGVTALRLITIIATLTALLSTAFWLYLRQNNQESLAGTQLEQPPYVGDLDLEHIALGSIQLESLTEGYRLIFFGFTRCPDVCPLTMARLQRIYQSLGEPDNLQVIMVTVDPEYDTPELIHNYATAYHDDFIGLGGSQEQIAKATRAFFVAARDAGNGQFIHTDAAFIVNPEGELVLIYNPDKQRDLETDLRKLL